MTHCFVGLDMHSQVTVDHLAMMDQDHTSYCTGVEARVAHWTDDVWAMNMEDVQGRSGKACRIHWHNHCKPSLNHGTWSEQEEAHLRALAAQHGQRKVGRGLGNVASQALRALCSFVWCRMVLCTTNTCSRTRTTTLQQDVIVD